MLKHLLGIFFFEASSKFLIEVLLLFLFKGLFSRGSAEPLKLLIEILIKKLHMSFSLKYFVEATH